MKAPNINKSILFIIEKERMIINVRSSARGPARSYASGPAHSSARGPAHSSARGPTRST